MEIYALCLYAALFAIDLITAENDRDILTVLDDFACLSVSNVLYHTWSRLKSNNRRTYDARSERSYRKHVRSHQT